MAERLRRELSLRNPAADEIARALAAAREHHRAGRLDAAEALYRQILLAEPGHAGAMQLLAVLTHRRGRQAEAIAWFRRAIAADPDCAAADSGLGNLLEAQGDLDGAAICHQHAVRLRPGDAAAHADLGRVLAARGEPAAAIDAYRRAAVLTPADPAAHNRLGNALARHGALAEAVASYRQALALRPDFAEAHSNLGDALRRLGRLDEAAAACAQAVTLKPDLAEAHNNLGNVLREAGEAFAAQAAYERALTLRPDWAEAYNNLGNALRDQIRTAEAIQCYERAIAVNPGIAEAHANLGNALAECSRAAEATAAFRRALALRPDYPEALIQLVHVKAELCDWDQSETEAARVLDVMRRHPGTVPPFNLHAQASTPAEQLLCARHWSERVGRGRSANFVHRRRAAPRRIRLGYVSADFRDHPVAYAIVETIERHDRRRFEILGYSIGPDDGSTLRRRFESVFDRFIDLHGVGNGEAAAQIHRDEVDILVDLTGYTRHARPRILISRPAPIQVNYLGFLGTMGADFIDYIIVDPFIAPATQQPFFSEKLVHLAGCWWPAALRWDIAAAARPREDYGLLEEAFVFCCFNTSYKIAPPVFDVWMRLLRAIPHSVFWLGGANRVVCDNLRREAGRRGVEPDRLVFAPREPMADYLARHRRADLFLDTLPYNAVGTAYHALWAGLPVLTCAGETFASRTAGTLLRAAGLPGLVATSLEEYERRALDLARSPQRLHSIRERLGRARSEAPLFNPDRFARDSEAAFARMWEIRLAGEPPRPFALGPAGA